jgi:molybdopterin synthase sulfur carrier subunit
MSVRIRLPSVLQELSCGAETCEVTGQTVGECIKSLEARFPEIKNHLFDRQGKLLRIFGIYLKSNGFRPVDLDTPVQENDELIVLSFIMGG